MTRHRAAAAWLLLLAPVLCTADAGGPCTDFYA